MGGRGVNFTGGKSEANYLSNFLDTFRRKMMCYIEEMIIRIEGFQLLIHVWI